MNKNYPKKYKITSGYGKGAYELVAFDKALIDAGISNYNLLRVSSILPIRCNYSEIIDLEEGSPLLTAYGTISSNTKGEIIASAVGIGIPKDKEKVGVIMEYSGRCTAEIAEKTVRDMTKIAMDNHHIETQEVISSSIEKQVTDTDYVSVISAVAMW